MTCIGCPMGCSLEVSRNADGTITVRGATCARGEAYGRQEATAPKRMVTGLVAIHGARRPLSVKTASPVPKEKIPDVLACLRSVCAASPVKIGAVIIPDVANTGISIIATANA